MHHLSRVLVAVDFSPPALDAFEYALALSKDHGAELTALQAVPPEERFSWQARERRLLLAALRARAEQAHVTFTDTVQQGDAAEIILLHAQTLRPDVMVMGTHQRRGLDRLLMGSIGERVMAKATVPILMVGSGRRPDMIRPFRHVAVAVDFGAGTHAALNQASTMASAPWGRITLLHVAPSSSSVPADLLAYGLVGTERPSLSDARQRLDALAARVKQQTDVDVQARLLIGETTTVIPRTLERLGADLVIVGVPKRNAISRALFGTTATRLLTAIRVPMLAIPDAVTAAAAENCDSMQRAA